MIHYFCIYCGEIYELKALKKKEVNHLFFDYYLECPGCYKTEFEIYEKID